MKKTIFITIAIVVVFLLLAFTRPEREQHCDAVAQRVESVLNGYAHDNLPQNSTLGTIGAALGHIINDAVAEPLVDYAISYHNYVVCSTATISYRGEDKIVSLGLLGKVFTIDNEKIVEYLSGVNPILAPISPDSDA